MTIGHFGAAVTKLVGFGLGWSGEQVAVMIAFVEPEGRDLRGRQAAGEDHGSP